MFHRSFISSLFMPLCFRVGTQTALSPRKARTMNSPRTGEKLQVAAGPASTAVKVRVLAGLKQMVE